MTSTSTVPNARPPLNENPPTRPHASGRLAALINPLSFRMSADGRAGRCAERIRAHGGEVFMVAGLAEIEQALDAALGQSTRRLVIAGGDGTLQAAVSYLARTLPAGQFPQLIVVGGGRTNYVAADVGNRFTAALDEILAGDQQQVHTAERSTLHLQHPSIGEQHGFFLAGAMVDEVIRAVHGWTKESPRWAQSRAASVLGVTAIGLRWALGRHRFEQPELHIEAAGLDTLDGRCRFLLLTTLSQQNNRIRPYARRGQGLISITAMRREARGLWMRLPRLLRGRFTASMNSDMGYLSGACNNIMINNITKITLDGQEFDLDPTVALRVTAGPTFRFLHA